MERIYQKYTNENTEIFTYRYFDDTKYHLTNNQENKTLILNESSGYLFEIPTINFEFDYSLSSLRCKYFFDNSVLTTSFENKNPYTDKKEKGWEIYLKEWLIPYLSNDEFLKNNQIEKIIENNHEHDFLNKYERYSFYLHIKEMPENYYPFYCISIIRNKNNYKNFYLFVFKSKTNQIDTFEKICKSFKEIQKRGKALNVQVEYQPIADENWNDETKKYYAKLSNQKSIDWGIFTKSLVSKQDDAFDYISNFYKNEGDFYDKNMEHNFELLPTYMHISWFGKFNYFPKELANEYAKGDGFNKKKVLHFTFQYTASNNTSMVGYTPVFDVLRGKYDEYFRLLAKDLKEYHHPILFRLNNEMNTDWTSYAGIITLLDPDIFIASWKRLYEIFQQEQVDNCIWIFNPIAITTPYSNWGEYLNYYPKGMVHMLGLTAYERGNMKKYHSFTMMYKKLYQKNTPYFVKFPHIISEFGAGCGGEVVYDYEQHKYLFLPVCRNLDKQVNFVNKMFDEIKKYPDYVKNIKAAIWFSANDYANVNNKDYIMNYFCLDEKVAPTISAFKKGFKKVDKKSKK